MGYTPQGCKESDMTETFSLVQFSHSGMSDSLRPHESQYTGPPCPSPAPGVHQTHVHSHIEGKNNVMKMSQFSENVMWGKEKKRALD